MKKYKYQCDNVSCSKKFFASNPANCPNCTSDDFTLIGETNKLWLWVSVLLVFVVVIISYSFYIEKKKLEKSENLRILKLEEENNLRAELDDIIEQYDNSRDEIDHLHVDLGKKQSEIDSLKSEIRDLLNVKHDLKKAKKKIIKLQNISKKYFDQIDSLLGKTEELQLQNETLEEENTVIKNKNEDLNSENTDLNARLDLGSTLEVSKIEIEKLKYGSHGQERSVIWAKNIQVLRCCFQISANQIAKAEEKSVYIQYISPKGEILQSSSTPKESAFIYEDLTVKATTWDVFNYQNNEIELCLDWQRGDLLEKGKYKILFFIEGKLVGKSSFKLI